jgi:hypothetical protein
LLTVTTTSLGIYLTASLLGLFCFSSSCFYYFSFISLPNRSYCYRSSVICFSIFLSSVYSFFSLIRPFFTLGSLFLLIERFDILSFWVSMLLWVLSLLKLSKLLSLINFIWIPLFFPKGNSIEQLLSMRMFLTESKTHPHRYITWLTDLLCRWLTDCALVSFGFSKLSS